MSESLPSHIRQVELVAKANELLSCLHVPKYIQHAHDITASVFVALFDAVYGEPLQDVIRNPSSHEDEVHNCQAVIDELAMGILNMSLYHITGEEVVRGKLEAVHDLLDVFDGLVEFLQDKISSVSTDLEEDRTRELADMDDPDIVTPEVIDDILARELQQNFEPPQEFSSIDHSFPKQSMLHGNNQTMNSTAELAALGNSSRYSDLKDDGHTTTDLIALGLSRNETESHIQRSSEQDASLTDHSGGRDIVSDVSSDPSGKYVWTSDPDPPRSLEYNGKKRENLSGRSKGISTQPLGGILHQSSNSIEKPNRSVTINLPVTNTSPTRPLMTSNSGRLANTEPFNVHSGSAYAERRDDALASTSLSALQLLPDRNISTEGSSVLRGTDFPQLLPPTTDPELKYLGLRPQPLAQSVAPAASQLLQNHTITHHMYHHYNNTPIAGSARHPLSSSMPVNTAPSTAIDPLSHSQPGPTLPVEQHPNLPSAPLRTISNSQKPKVTDRSLDFSQQSQSATDSSTDLGPAHRQRDSQVRRLKASNVDQELTKSIRGALQELHERRSLTEPQVQSILSPGKKIGDRSRKNVSFLARGSSTDTSKSSQSSINDVQSTSNKNKVALSFNEYKQKYYPGRPGERLRARSLSDEHINYYGTDSDSDHRSGMCLSGDADVSGLSAELEAFRKKIEKKAKTVTFDDLLDDSAPGRMGTIRRKLKKEDRRGRMKKEVLHHLYKEELGELEQRVEEHLACDRTKAHDTEQEFKKKVFKDTSAKKSKPGTKYKASVGVLVPRGRSPSRFRNRRRSASASPTIGYHAPESIYDQEILPWLLEEFPFLHLTPETMQALWQRSAHQVSQLSKAERDLRKHKSSAQQQVEDAERRQKVLTDIVKKELEHNQRLREVRDRQRATQAVKSAVRDKRMQSANARRYYQEYQVRMRSKMLKKRSKEEQVFKKLFHDGLDIQKDRIRELRKYAKEQRNVRAKKQQNELESIENYYKDQFRMLAEAMARERDDMEIREKAQGKMVTSLKREQRNHLETEVKRLQEAIYHDDDDVYFRELDAERARTQLNLARYQARV